MSATAKGLSLQLRLFLVSAGTVALAIGIALGAVLLFGGRVAQDATSDFLAAGYAIHDHFLESRGQRLESVTEQFAADPALTGYLAAAGLGGFDREAIDRNSIADLLAERLDSFGFDELLVLDADGVVVADGNAGLTGNRLSAPAIRRAVDELRPDSGLGLLRGRLSVLAIAPVAERRDLIGFLVAAEEVGDDLATQMGRISRGHVAFLRPTDGKTEVVASTLDVGEVAALERRLAELSLASDQTMRPAGRVRFSEVAHVLRVDPLLLGEPHARAWLLAAAPVDRPLSGLRRIRTILLLAGAGSVLLALALSYGVARRLLRPMRQLASAADSASRGDYDQPIPQGGGVELAQLAGAFRKLLADLRGRRETEGYLAEIARHLPDSGPGSELTPRAILHTVDARLGGGPVTTGPFSPGGLIGSRYEILERLGQGGMGVVFKARDRALGELVALKTLHGDSYKDSKQIEHIKNELKIARKITHPNIVRTHDFGEVDGVPYLSMEYVRGLTLDYLLRESGKLPLAPGLRLARQLCGGLGAAHAAGILHRDIKPSNVILELSGDAKLMDFGIALPKRLSNESKLVVGTPMYMAPEQFVGGDSSEQSDVYALGLLMIEVFSGEQPFRDQTLQEMARSKQQGILPGLLEEPSLPQALTAILRRCVATAPADRFEGVDPLERALGEVWLP